MPEITYEVVKHIATLSDEKGGWVKEVNLVSWNGGSPKFDIRNWNSDHSRMAKGITLTNEEALALKKALEEEFQL